MNAKKIFLTTLGVIMVCLLAIGLIFGNSSTVSADAVKDKVRNETYLDYIRSTATTEVVGDFTKYFIPDTKTVEIYDDKLKPMLNMTWLTDYEEKVSSGTETEVACARVDYIDDKVLPVFNQIKSYDKKNNYEEISKDFIMKIKRPITSESCYNEVINNETNEMQESCYEYDDTELIDIDSLIDVKYFPQEVCWYTNTELGDNVEFVIGNGDFWLAEFASFLVTDIVSYYKNDDNLASTVVIDAVGNNDGTASTNTENLFAAGGMINSNFNFDGTENVLGVGFPGYNDFSISLWFRQANIANGEYSYNAEESSGDAILQLLTISSKMNLRMRDNTAGGFVALPTATLSSNTWYHIVATFKQSTGAIKLYVDAGTPVTSTYSGGSFSDINQGSLASTVASTAFFTGDLDEVGIWDRELNTTEIDFLYAGGNPESIQQYPFEMDCQFSGFVFDEQGNAIVGANITIWNQFDVSEFYENTTIAGGAWTMQIVNSTNTYMAGAYFNNTIIGQLKPYISGTC